MRLRKTETDDVPVTLYRGSSKLPERHNEKLANPIFVRDVHGSSCLSSADDLDTCWKTKLVNRDIRIQELVRQSGDLIAYAPLDR